MQTWVYWIIISASFYFIFFFTQATSARSCIFYGASPVTMLMCELAMITQIINDPDRMKNEDICGQCRADPQHIHCRCLCPPHSVCAEPAVRWRHDGDWHQPSPRVLLWASWTGPQEGAPTSVIPLKKYHFFFFFYIFVKMQCSLPRHCTHVYLASSTTYFDTSVHASDGGTRNILGCSLMYLKYPNNKSSECVYLLSPRASYQSGTQRLLAVFWTAYPPRCLWQVTTPCIH